VTDLLKFNMDGVSIRHTDLTQFKTEHALQQWRKRVMRLYDLVVHEPTSSVRFDVMDQLDELLQKTCR
jgi:hypothetical protein